MLKKVGLITRMVDLLLKIYAGLTYRGCTKWVPDETHLKLMYRQATGVWPEFKKTQDIWREASMDEAERPQSVVSNSC